jgi:predicted dinucleotide-binding enzyme
VKIGIIGPGNVGGTLGRRWAINGHNVVFGTRKTDPEALRGLLSQAGPNASKGSIAQAVGESEVVVLAVPWAGAEQVLARAGNLEGKILIDATNALAPGLSGLVLGAETSAGEMVAGWASGARTVKAFNTVGSNIMADPHFAGGRVAMFYCGDDAEAKKTVASLIAELGFDPVDAGPLTQARVLEQFALLWISLAMKYGYGREIGFQFLRRGNK